jgi:hypothetical protein
MIFLQLTAIAVIVGAEVNAAVELGAMQADATNTAGVPGVPGTVPALVAGHAATIGVAANGSSVNGSAAGGGAASEDESTLSFGKALAGLIALFALARGVKD